MPGWGLGHLTYGEESLIRTAGGSDPSAKPGTGGAASPCRAFYMLTLGTIHGQEAVKKLAMASRNLLLQN
jgi:hypothetical protein